MQYRLLTKVFGGLVLGAGLLSFVSPAHSAPASKPNLLWLVAEDINPQLACFGDKYSVTPNIDKLAEKGTRYPNCWSAAPVCAPARTALISGMWPPSVGGEHMRSMVNLPAGFKMYPQYLREAGYYCCNNAKEDYNVEKQGEVWNESSKSAHYSKRAAGQPFMAAFNHEITHESQIRTRPHTWVHDLAKAPLPAYHPDTKEVREDWAQYYDNITTMDGQVGKKLKELEAAGLADDTIIFFYGDNGGGMPRSKRWPYNSGLDVPLIVYIPEKFKDLRPKDYRPGGVSERLVEFFDFAPTLLSLAGVKPPEHMQGRAFLGKFEAAPREYIHGFRGRMDERYDCVRSVRDQRYIYIRNYMPHKIYGAHIAYMFETPTTRVWKQLFDEGKLNPVQSRFWQTKPPEELYDLQNDRDEINNLANSPQHQEILQRLRQAQQDWALQTRDVGLMPEHEFHARAKGSSPYEVGHDDSKYPLKRVLEAADLASNLKPEALPQLKALLGDADSVVRYWAVLGHVMRGQEAVQGARAELAKALADSSPIVRVAAGEALSKYGNDAESKQAIDVLLQLAPQDKNGPYLSVMALAALDGAGQKASYGLDIIKQSAAKDPTAPERASGYAARLVEDIVEKFEGKKPEKEPKAGKGKGKGKGKKSAE